MEQAGRARIIRMPKRAGRAAPEFAFQNLGQIELV